MVVLCWAGLTVFVFMMYDPRLTWWEILWAEDWFLNDSLEGWGVGQAPWLWVAGRVRVCVCVCTAAPWMVCCMTEQLAVVMERRRLRWKEVRAAIVYCPPWLVLATRRNAKQASPRFNCHSLGQSWSWSQLSHFLQALIVTSVIVFILIGDL